MNISPVLLFWLLIYVSSMFLHRVFVFLSLTLVNVAVASTPYLEVYGLRDVVIARGGSIDSIIPWKTRALSISDSYVAASPVGVELRICQMETCRSTGMLSDLKRSSLAIQASSLSSSLPVGVYTYSIRVLASNTTFDTYSTWASANWFVAPNSIDFSNATYICTSPLANNTGTSMLRTTFTLNSNKPITSALLSVLGLGQQYVELNGMRVGRDAVAPAWVDWRKQALFSTYDVSALLLPTSTFEVTLGNGMYNVQKPPPPDRRYSKFENSMGPRMLLLQLDVQFSDGSLQQVTSSPLSWQGTESGPITFSHQYGGEDFDMSKSPIPESAWSQAQSCQSLYPGGALAPAEFEPVRVARVMAPVATTTPDVNTTQFDFGINLSGFVSITFDLSALVAPITVVITPAEWRNRTSGAISQDSSGKPMYWRLFLQPSATPFTFEPRFSTYGWRWVDVSNVTNGANLPKILNISAHYVHSDVVQVGTWVSSNDQFNAIHGLTTNAILANLGNTLTDCPHRERLGWLETTHLLSRSIGFNYDVASYYAKVSRDTVASQQPDGMVPDIAPEYTVFAGSFRDSPEWGIACILNPYFAYRFYGDINTLNATYATGKAYLLYLATKLDPATGLITYGLGDWLDTCGDGPGVCTPVGVTGTAVFIKASMRGPKPQRFFNTPLILQSMPTFHISFAPHTTRTFSTSTPTRTLRRAQTQWP
jgi:Bacterial alpha-L-rhamnosidase 6 hairpin glycosidase domain/Alpha-L-rhamnosidase N-terminal domain